MQIDVRTPIRRFKKPLIWSGVVFATLVLLGFVAVPPLVKSRLIRKLSVALHREVSIPQIRFNPFTFSLTLIGFLVKTRDARDTFVSFDELFLNCEGFSVLRKVLILKGVRLSQPFIRILRHQDNSYNFADLLEKALQAFVWAPFSFLPFVRGGTEG